MSILLQINPYELFVDKSGTPLDNGYIYIGMPNVDPRQYPVAIFYDEALTIPAAQPLRTSNGYIVRNGSPSFLYVNGNYSIIVQDKNQEQIYYVPDFLFIGNSVAVSAGDLANTDDPLKGDNLVGFKQPVAGSVGSTVHNKLAEYPGIKTDYGAAANGLTDDLSKVNLAVATPRKSVWTADASYLVSAPPTNIYGVEYDGAGKILLPITGGNQQLNTYADKDKYAIGKEYLFRAYQYLALGQSSSAGTIRVQLYGDSTIAGDQGESAAYHVAPIIGRVALQKGIGNISITNFGVSGTTIADLDAISNLGGNPAIIVIKYGINDGGLPEATRLNTFATTLRSKLSAIRAAPGGALGAVAILLVGPNSTSDTPNNRDERWYEQLRGIYNQAARDYQCAYFDTYAFLKDSRGAAGLWMDNPFGDGRAIHPLDAMNAWIWGGVWDWAFSFGEISGYRSNQFTNVGAVNGLALPTTPPSQYALGISMQRATAANGWSEDGVVITTRSVDSVAMQQLFPFAADRTRLLVRTANIAGDTWNRFSGTIYPITLLNSWVDYDPTQATYAATGAMQTADGMIKVIGAIKNGVTTSGTFLATLPVGFRPAAPEYFPSFLAGGTTGWVSVNTDGTIRAVGAVNATLTTLNNILFRAA